MRIRIRNIVNSTKTIIKICTENDYRYLGGRMARQRGGDSIRCTTVRLVATVRKHSAQRGTGGSFLYVKLDHDLNLIAKKIKKRGDYKKLICTTLPGPVSTGTLDNMHHAYVLSI